MLTLPDLQNSVSFIHQHGYGIIPIVFSTARFAVASDELSRSEFRSSRAGARHVLSQRSVTQITNSDELLAIARGVLGSTALPYRATYLDKSLNSNWLVSWHQDTALPLTAKREGAGWGPWSTKHGVADAHAPAAALERVRALRIHLDDSIEPMGHCA